MDHEATWRLGFDSSCQQRRTYTQHSSTHSRVVRARTCLLCRLFCPGDRRGDFQRFRSCHGLRTNRSVVRKALAPKAMPGVCKHQIWSRTSVQVSRVGQRKALLLWCCRTGQAHAIPPCGTRNPRIADASSSEKRDVNITKLGYIAY